MSNLKLTASIVLYNTPRSQIDMVLKSVFESGCVEILYIIDNSPSDRWRILENRNEGDSKNTKIRYIHNENLGYGASHNLAMQEAIESGVSSISEGGATVSFKSSNYDTSFTSSLLKNYERQLMEYRRLKW